MRKIQRGKIQNSRIENSPYSLRRKNENSRKKVWTLGDWVTHWYSTYKEIVRP